MSAVEVPFVDPLEAAMRAAAAAARPGALTLAVLAGVAGIAASVAVIAASYDATVLQPQRVVTAAPVTVPIVARGAPVRAAAMATDPFVVASIAPAAVAATAGVPVASPATAVRPILTYPAPGNPLAEGADAAQPAEPPHPRLRPPAPPAVSAPPASVATPAPKVTLVAAPTPSRIDRVPYSLGVDAGPDSDPSGPATATHSDELPAPAVKDESSGPGPGDLANNQGNDSGPVESLFRDVGQVLSALPPKAEPNVVVVTLAQAGAVRLAGSAVPLPPAPLPAVIAGAPAVAATTGQLLFALPPSAIIVPATMGMPVTATSLRLPGGEVGRVVHVLMPPARPRLRAPLVPGDVLIFATPS